MKKSKKICHVDGCNNSAEFECVFTRKNRIALCESHARQNYECGYYIKSITGEGWEYVYNSMNKPLITQQ